MTLAVLARKINQGSEDTQVFWETCGSDGGTRERCETHLQNAEEMVLNRPKIDPLTK